MKAPLSFGFSISKTSDRWTDSEKSKNKQTNSINNVKEQSYSFEITLRTLPLIAFFFSYSIYSLNKKNKQTIKRKDRKRTRKMERISIKPLHVKYTQIANDKSNRQNTKQLKVTN